MYSNKRRVNDTKHRRQLGNAFMFSCTALLHTKQYTRMSICHVLQVSGGRFLLIQQQIWFCFQGELCMCRDGEETSQFLAHHTRKTHFLFWNLGNSSHATIPDVWKPRRSNLDCLAPQNTETVQRYVTTQQPGIWDSSSEGMCAVSGMITTHQVDTEWGQETQMWTQNSAWCVSGRRGEGGWNMFGQVSHFDCVAFLLDEGGRVWILHRISKARCSSV